MHGPALASQVVPQENAEEKAGFVLSITGVFSLLVEPKRRGITTNDLAAMVHQALKRTGERVTQRYTSLHVRDLNVHGLGELGTSSPGHSERTARGSAACAYQQPLE